jgi:hypothetical protein
MSLGNTLRAKKASRSDKTSGSLFMYLKSQQRAAEAQKSLTATFFPHSLASNTKNAHLN